MGLTILLGALSYCGLSGIQDARQHPLMLLSPLLKQMEGVTFVALSFPVWD